MMLEIKIKEEKIITDTYKKVWYEVKSDIPITVDRLYLLRKAGYIGIGKEWFHYDDATIHYGYFAKVIEDRIDIDDL